MFCYAFFKKRPGITITGMGILLCAVLWLLTAPVGPKTWQEVQREREAAENYRHCGQRQRCEVRTQLYAVKGDKNRGGRNNVEYNLCKQYLAVLLLENSRAFEREAQRNYREYRGCCSGQAEHIAYMGQINYKCH